MPSDVQTRSLTGVRSELEAVLVAFDKHWNVGLSDVDELYFRSRTRRVFRSTRVEGVHRARAHTRTVHRRGLRAADTAVHTR